MEAILSTPNIVEAEQILAALSQADIEARIIEDNGTFISASGNIVNYRIMVNDGDTDAAKNIVSDYRARNKATETMPWCPECGSEDVSETVVRHKHGSIWFLVLAPIMLVVGFFSPPFFFWLFTAGAVLFIIQYFIGYKTHRYHCNKCHHIFKRY